MQHHPGSHDTVLVALSILIAALASYTALDLATRMRATGSSTASLGWLVAAAVAMGGGIWSMHFVAMLAFSLPGIEISYDPLLTLLSLAIPIMVAAAAFVVVSQRPEALIVSGIGMGLAISGMHYTGMGAMRMGASIQYDIVWVAISIAIAIGASIIALWLAFHTTSGVQRACAGIVMGSAISGMHYAAMQGSSFIPMKVVLSYGHGAVTQAPLAFLVAGATIGILVIGLTAAVYDRAFAERAGREAEMLRRSEEKFRLLVEGVADHAIFMLDSQGHVANWNLGAHRLIGYGEEIIGAHYGILHTVEDRDLGVPDLMLAAATRDGKSVGEGLRVRKDGSQFWAEATIRVVRNELGEAIGFAKIVRDVSERRRAQEALDRTRDALAVSQKMETIGQLTGGVAHDFNNILAVILGSLELAKKRLHSEDPRILRLLDNAMQGAARGASLTQRMLAFARKQDLKPVVVDVPELVRGMAALLKFDPGIRVETQFPLELSRVKVDANQLELAILNLAVNARDAIASSGGVISIAAREEQAIDGLAPGRYVALSVSDTGAGMDEETLRHAQEPFFTTKGVGKGTGLGLSMVKGLAEQSGGVLRLKSRRGEGTTAEIWLPASEEQVAPAPEPLRAASRSRPAVSVLLVDDDLLVLENIAAMLDDLGHAVIEARSGEEALQLLRRMPKLDIVVTDYAMPGMTGLQLAEAIATERPGMPVVLCTGYADLIGAARPHLPRLSKPFDQAALASAMEEAMSAASTRAVVTLHPKRA